MKHRILSVDADPAVRKRRGETFDPEEFEVVEAESGAEALEVFRTAQPHVALISGELPDGAGLEICRRIRAEESGTPVILLQPAAAHQGPATRAKSLEEGADGYLVEPVEPDLLLATVRSLLRLLAAERSARDSEQNLRLALTAGRMGTWSWQATTNEITWSPEVYELLGLESTAIPTAKASVDLMHPDDTERIREAFQTALRKRIPFECEYRVIRPNGTLLWVAARGLTTYLPNGMPQSHRGIVIDITERRVAEEALRKAENRFQRLWNANVVGIATAGDEIVLDANEVLLKLLGYSREELWEQKVTLRRVMAPEHWERHRAALSEIEKRGAANSYETEYVRKDGSRFWALVSSVRLQNDPFQCLYCIIDLTERKALERKIAENQHLEKLGLLAGGIAHDFNNLLVGILGYASLAEEMLPEGSAILHPLKEIQEASERAAHLTRQMLAYSGQGQFLIEQLDLTGVVRDAMELLRPSLPRKITVDLQLGEGLPPVSADAGQMQQIVLSLLMNAVEATGTHESGITVRTRLAVLDEKAIQALTRPGEASPGRYVEIEVADTGEGIEPGALPRIFEPFFTTRFTGRGLGLAAVDGIVRKLRGAIGVTSERGSGSTFRVLLPASALQEKQTTGPFAAREEAAPETVLVIDDEEIVLKTARMSLERAGYRVLVASSGAAGIDLLREAEHQISVVVLDLSMPGMSGLDTLAELRRVCPEVDVLISSGYSETESVQLFSGHTISGFIQKPYSARGLVKQVRERTSKG